MNVLLEKNGKVVWDRPLPAGPLFDTPWEFVLQLVQQLGGDEALKIYVFGHYLLEVKRDA